MMTDDEARRFAVAWASAWNAHDLDRIMSHYAPDVVLESPIAARLLGEPAGMVRGAPAVRAYFARGLAAYPDLQFTVTEVFRGVTSLVLVYTNQAGTRAAEQMELDADGRVIRMRAHYDR